MKEFEEALDLVMDAGQTLLENGSEVFRVQQTMEIMAHSLGVEDFHVYVLTNGIFASALGGRYAPVRHVPLVRIHLDRVEQVNALSRALAAGALTPAAARAALEQARAPEHASPAIDLLACVVGSACFGFLFGGGPAEVVVAGLAGLVEQRVVQWFGARGINRIFTLITASALATALAIAARFFVHSLNPASAIIGALMVLTPGVALTMGIRDILGADYLSGAIRLLDAVLVAGSLACGVALAWLAAQGLGVQVWL